MRVLVTGAAGFVGSHVVDRLVAEGHDVVALDRREPDAARRNPGAAWVTADVRDPDAWRQHARGTAAVCHQAAMVGLGVDLGDIRRYVDDTDVGTASGLLALHGLGWRGRFVLASSMVVYGEGLYRCAEHGDVRPAPRRPADLDAGRWDPPCPHCGSPLAWQTIDEEAPTDPRNVYAATKLHQEHLVAAFARDKALDAIALRYHNVYGPRLPLDTPYAGVAALFRTELAAGRPPRVFEDGGQTRDFVHVHDVVRANLAALTAFGEGAPGLRSYNVASGRPTTILQLARALARSLDGPDPQVVGGYRLGDVRHVVASPVKAETELGFRAEIALDDGLRHHDPVTP
jgi:dTDP-L-rhamnose 4-epimerase